MKKSMKWVIIGVILIVAIAFAFTSREKGYMYAVSEDGVWEAYAFETKHDGEKIWKGTVVYVGEKPEQIKSVRTQRCINGVKGKFTKRTLKAAGEEDVNSGDIGGNDQYYVFMKGEPEKPVSLSVKVKWKEKGKNKVEKLWLVNQ